MAREELVHQVAAGHYDPQGGPIAPSGPSQPLPGGGDGAGIAVEDGHVEGADVHPQLEGRSGDHTVQPARAQAALLVAPLAEQVAAAVSGHAGRFARVVVEHVLEVAREHLHGEPAAGEDDACEPGLHRQSGQPGGL